MISFGYCKLSTTLAIMFRITILDTSNIAIIPFTHSKGSSHRERVDEQTG